MTARLTSETPGHRSRAAGLVDALERFFVPDELLPDGTTDGQVVRQRYRRMVRTVAGLSAGLFVLSLAPAGVPADRWIPYTLAVAGTAALIAAVLSHVAPHSRVALPAAVAMAAVIFALDRFIGAYYHNAALLFALVVAGSSIIQGIPAATVLVLTGAALVPRSSPVAPDAPLWPVDHLFALLYLLGIAAIVWSYRRLAERGAAAVRASREQYRALVERVPAVVYTAGTDPALEWRYVSPRIAELTGESADSLAADPDSWRRHVHPDDLPGRLEAAAAAPQGGIAAEYRMIAADGSVHWVFDEAALVDGPVGAEWSGLLHDITARRELETQLRQVQRLDAVGRLAGGIAHDFNNLLTAIRGYGELVQAALPTGSPEHADMADLMGAADRAAALTRQLLAFSRRQAQRPEVLDPGDAIECMMPMLRRMLGEHIQLDLQRSPEPCHVRMDLSQLEQIVLNLAVNAGAAMPDGGRFAMGVAAAGDDADEIPRARPDAPAEPGRFTRLSFRDTGCGMVEETLAHAFEPFFTTRKLGEGTGLGLATVYGIVTQSQGRITCRSEPGAGTVFTVDLPWVPGEARAARPQPAATSGGARERILVVEDEAAVRELTCRMLVNMGYRVQAAASGAEALELVGAGMDVDLLLTDVRMPAMQGPELARRMRELRPGLRVQMMSGYVGGDDAPETQPSHRILAKPFDSASLSASVRAALDSDS